MIVNPTASWSSGFRLLGSQGYKGIKDNIDYYRGGKLINQKKVFKNGMVELGPV